MWIETGKITDVPENEETKKNAYLKSRSLRSRWAFIIAILEITVIRKLQLNLD